MPTAAATSALTDKGCGPNSIHFIYDTYGQTKTIVSALAKQQNGGDWFFITVDYAFGLAIEKDATQFIKAAGGKVVGSVHHPLNNQDFSSYVLQADASKAKNLIIANGGNDIINAVKQAAEFGLIEEGRAHQHSAGAEPRHPRHRPEDRPGPADLEPVLLRHDARGEGLHRALHQGDRPAAELHPGRHLRRGDALPQGGEGGGHRRGQGGAGRRCTRCRSTTS